MTGYTTLSRAQAEAAETIVEEDIEAGEVWYNTFGCIGCHGPDGGGGAAAFTEPRSGVDSPWTVPSLNDVLYRFDADSLELKAKAELAPVRQGGQGMKGDRKGGREGRDRAKKTRGQDGLPEEPQVPEDPVRF